MIEYWIDIPNLKTVHLPWSFKYVESKSITSICMNMNEWIDISTILEDLIPFTLDDINTNSKSIQIPNGSCNNLETLNYSKYTLLEELIIGDNCFSNVELFNIDGLTYLKSLKIGSRSFSTIKSAKDWNFNKVKNDCSRSFSILNCIELKSIEIGRFSFVAFGDKFELRNLPKLSTIKIGSIETDISESNDHGWSVNFVFASFEIKGIIELILLINRSSTFEFYWIRQ